MLTSTDAVSDVAYFLMEQCVQRQIFQLMWEQHRNLDE